ncbi:hypothetical protein HPB48_001340 [Haemaphysalis longicornis]|uniref:Uncharacterized protein n=1 Tax=Haemaphysalis longicornis TaxID=44386 RepID=A0A9J6GV33_HAELO|nr:hypothetical protein HPB48_001340 [Haemaphysalis longicornis]
MRPEFNQELSRHSDIMRRLCHENKLGACVCFISDAFEELPLKWFVTFDGFHPCCEGVALFSEHNRAPRGLPLRLCSRKMPTSCVMMVWRCAVGRKNSLHRRAVCRPGGSLCD